MPSSNPFDQQQAIPGVKSIIAISSGKGGVGKSTVAVNFAASLAKNHKVGLLDADIYGPSIPRMLGTLNQAPEANGDSQIVPIERYGMKIMSIGYLVEENTALIWRGPMLFKAMDQLLLGCAWGELDYLVVDLPPGTGDIQLSLVQKVPVSGAIAVCTPQNVALSDLKKSINMFEQVQVPVLGVIENMSYMINPETGSHIQIFPKGELDSYLAGKGMEKLASLPMTPSIALACEMGIPFVQSQPESVEAQMFLKVAQLVSGKFK